MPLLSQVSWAEFSHNTCDNCAEYHYICRHTPPKHIFVTKLLMMQLIDVGILTPWSPIELITSYHLCHTIWYHHIAFSVTLSRPSPVNSFAPEKQNMVIEIIPCLFHHRQMIFRLWKYKKSFLQTRKYFAKHLNISENKTNNIWLFRNFPTNNRFI